MSRKIAVITGTRAEYGLLYWTMRELQQLGADLQLIVTGAHLSADHGMTVKQIEADGFPIAARVDMQLNGDAPLDIARSMGLCIAGVASALDQLKPDLVVILGDRYEMLAAASATAMLNIPIAHIHGGEVTEGAVDESIRHAITKLSYWHFASTDAYSQRIIQLGEAPARVKNVGAPGVDNIALLPLLSREALEKELGIMLTKPVLLCTYHPETLSNVPPAEQLHAVTAALNAFPDATIIVTGANADTGGRAINALWQAFTAAHPRALFRASFGSLLYLSAMKHADVVVGNSSSGMIETPAMGNITVNIGNRQKGRIRTPGVIDCACDTNAIKAAITKALSQEFKKNAVPSSVFGEPGSVGKKIAHELMNVEIPKTPYKPFYDL